jgi:protein-ribulosamine 3-kinase
MYYEVQVTSFFQYGDKEARELWSRLQHKVPDFFKDLTIEPSLLHGDLWGGNVAESSTGPGKIMFIF